MFLAFSKEKKLPAVERVVIRPLDLELLFISLIKLDFIRLDDEDYKIIRLKYLRVRAKPILICSEGFNEDCNLFA